MTNKEILEVFEALSSLRERVTVRFPANTAYAIIRNMRILQPIAEDIVTARMGILRKYGDPVDGQPGYYSPKIGESEAMYSALDELDKIENEISLYKFPMEVLDGLELSLADMDALYFMVDG